MKTQLEFFYDFTSPYSYLASTQVEKIAGRHQVELRWRPFLLGAVFKATGNNSPATVAAKAIYMGKDLLDWTKLYGLPDLILPEDFPSNAVMADRLALVAAEHGKIAAFTHALYRRIFTKGLSPAAQEVHREVLIEVGIDPDLALERVASQEIKDLLRKNTDEAVSRGAFGAPTLFVGEDMYVGNDRLPFVERALERLKGAA